MLMCSVSCVNPGELVAGNGRHLAAPTADEARPLSPASVRVNFN
jgi:hypothetical protein